MSLDPTVTRSLSRGLGPLPATGLGSPLDEAIGQPGVTDVLVNADGSIWLDRGDGVGPWAGASVPAQGLRPLAVRLAALAGRRLDESMPWVDGLLPGGIRLHALLPPIAADGVHISLRVPRREAIDLDDLVQRGSIDRFGRRVLDALVASRVGFLITGGTGSGKTTVLGALLARVPGSERIVLVEDVRELVVAHPHVVCLQSRPDNVEGRGAVGLSEVVRQALRMRPDRLVVGEVRGCEIRDLMLALNTGHEGGCGTLHANGMAEVPARVEALAALAGVGPEAARTQLGAAIQAVVHLRRVHGQRGLGAVGAVSADGRRVLPAWSWTGSPSGAGPSIGPGAEGLRRRGVDP